MESGVALVVRCIDAGAPVHQRSEKGHVASPGGPHQGGLAFRMTGIDTGAPIE
jgi:hypothetical protein